MLRLLRSDPAAPLIAALASEAEAPTAIEALVALGDAALPRLKRAVWSQNPVVREGAVRALVTMRTPQAAEVLCGLLSHRDLRVREQAVAWAVEIGAPAVVPLSYALRAWRTSTREAAAHALCTLAEGAHAAAMGPAVEPLCRVVETGRIRRATPMVRALGRIGNRKALPTLRRLLLYDRDADVAAAAAAALAEIGGKAEIKFLTEAAQVGPALVTRAAYAVLGQIGGPEAAAALCTALKRSLGDDERRHAEAALHRLRHAAVGRALALLQARLPAARLSGGRLLAELGDARALHPLCQLLRHADPHIRLSAAAALVQLGHPGAAPALAGLLEDRDHYVRMEVAHGLLQLGWQPGTPRERAALLLVRGEDAAAAGEALLPPLCEILRSPSRALRCDAAHALGEMGRREALPALRAQLRLLGGEADGEVRSALSAAITRIEGSTGATRSLPRSLTADPLATEGRPRTEGADPPAERRPRVA